MFPNTKEHIASYFQNVADWITPTRHKIIEKSRDFDRVSIFLNQINYLPLSLKEKAPISKRGPTKLTMKQKEKEKAGELTVERNDKGEMIMPRYDCVTTHIARRSGITNMYLSHKFTIVQMMHVSGHKTQKTFMDYIKLSSDEIADEIDAIVNGAKEEVF